MATVQHGRPEKRDDVASERGVVGGERRSPAALRELGAEGGADRKRFWPGAKTVNNARNEDPR